MNVTACLVTKGDVDMQTVLDSLPPEWEVLVWDNGEKACYREPPPNRYWNAADLSVYGRYAAIEYATHDMIYVQDDDVIVSDPQAIVDTYEFLATCPDHGLLSEYKVIHGTAGWLCRKHSPIRFSSDAVVCNMSQEFRPHYPDAALVGFGACFHRDAPRRAFQRFEKAMRPIGGPEDPFATPGLFNRECDRVFTVLTPRVLVDVAKNDRPFSADPDRLWKQPGHHDSTRRMLDLARRVRDA